MGGFRNNLEQPSFGAVNTSVLVAYLLLVTVLAVVLSGRQKDTRAYFLAGGRMPWLAVSLSVTASLLSALSYLGAPALAYEENASFALGPVILLMTAPLVILLFFPIYRRLGVTSIYEYVNRRFGQPARYATSVFAILQIQGWMGLALYAPALALSTVTGMDLVGSILIMGAVATLYTALGGLAAVIWTDVIQFLVLSSGALLVAVSLSSSLPGGVDQILEVALAADKLPRLEFGFRLDQANLITVAICNFVVVFSQYGTSQVTVQRLLAVRNVRQMYKAVFLDVFMQLLVVGLLFLHRARTIRLFPEFSGTSCGRSGGGPDPALLYRPRPAGGRLGAPDRRRLRGVHVHAGFGHPLHKHHDRRGPGETSGLNPAHGAAVVDDGAGNHGGAGRRRYADGTAVFQSGRHHQGGASDHRLRRRPGDGSVPAGLLTRRGHFRGWLAATLAVVLPLSYYVQNHTQVHWLLYGPVSAGSCLMAAYLCSRILRPPAWAPAEALTIWSTQTTSGTTKGAR